jgi:trypsin-like peptidase
MHPDGSMLRTAALAAILCTSVSAKRIGERASWSVFDNAIVKIKSTGVADGIPRTGSGFIVDSIGTIVTNFHVIRNSLELEISLGRQKCEILATDRIHDIAILRAKDFVIPGDLQGAFVPIPLEIGSMRDTSYYRTKKLLIFHYPELFGLLTESVAIMGLGARLPNTKRSDTLYGKGTADHRYFLHNGKTSVGSSGGPLIDLATGKAIGVNVGILGKGGFPFAVPIEYAVTLLHHGRDSLPPKEYWNAGNQANPGDPYYSELSLYADGQAQAAEMRFLIKGPYGARGSLARVHVSDSASGVEFAPIIADLNGRFTISLPRNQDAKWRMDVDHGSFERKILGPFTIKDWPPAEIQMLPKGGALAIDTQLFLDRLFVPLRKSEAQNFFRCEVLGGSVPCNSRWSVSSIPEWLTLDPVSGELDKNMQLLRIKYNRGRQEEDGMASIKIQVGDSPRLNEVFYVCSDTLGGDLAQVWGYVEDENRQSIQNDLVRIRVIYHDPASNADMVIGEESLSGGKRMYQINLPAMYLQKRMELKVFARNHEPDPETEKAFIFTNGKKINISMSRKID